MTDDDKQSIASLPLIKRSSIRVLLVDTVADDLKVLSEALAGYHIASLSIDSLERAEEVLLHQATRFDGVVVGERHGDFFISLRDKLANSPGRRFLKLFGSAAFPYGGGFEHLVNDPLIKIVPSTFTPAEFASVISSCLQPDDKSRLRYEYGIFTSLKGAVIEVLGRYVGAELNFGKPSLKRPDLEFGEFCAFNHLTAEGFVGSLVVSFDRHFIEQLYRVVFCIDNKTKCREEDLWDVTAEICNQISGKAQALLQQQGFDPRCGIPVTNFGASSIIMHPGSNDVGVIPFKPRYFMVSQLGDMEKNFIEFCFDMIPQALVG